MHSRRRARFAFSRRSFLRAAAAAAAGAAMPSPLRGGPAEPPSYPPEDLTAFDRPITPRPFALRMGYAAITWGGKDEQAIEEIAALGFHGIQLRSGVLERYGDKPAELRRLLEEKGLSLLCFSSGGNPDADPDKQKDHLENHVRNARFVKDLGGKFLQIISRRPKDRVPTPAEYERVGRLLTDIGRRTLDLGVRLVYHNHMNGFGEAPDEVARLLDASDRRFVSLLLDIAHYAQGGGDPVAAVTRHKDRIEVIHLKDVVSPVPGDTKPPHDSYRFVELGRGKVDVPGVIAALEQIHFRGPAIIELDAVPDPARSPKECAAINKQYVVEKLGLTL